MLRNQLLLADGAGDGRESGSVQKDHSGEQLMVFEGNYEPILTFVSNFIVRSLRLLRIEKQLRAKVRH
jgi:hypothetical protein